MTDSYNQNGTSRTDDKDIDRLKATLERAKSLRLPHEAELRDCYLFTVPGRECFLHQTGSSVDRHRLYDSTATDGVLNLVTLTMRLLFPQNDRWAGIELREEHVKKWELLKRTPVPTEITQAINTFNDLLFGRINQSNFYLAVDEALHDNTICGTGCLANYGTDSYTSPVEYRAITPDSLYFTEDAQGRPDVVFREHKLTARQLQQRWPGKLPKEIADEAQTDKSKEAKHKVLETEEPVGTGRNRRYRYTVHLCTSDWHELANVSNYRYRVFNVFRWSKAAKEPWGESQVRHALPSIRSLNRLVQLIETHGEYQAFGLWQTQDSSYDASKLTGKLAPGALINSEEEIKPIEIGGNFQIADKMLADLRGQIKQLLFDSPLPPTTQNNYMSATEVNVRQTEYYRRIGQPALRLEEELLEPVVYSTVRRLIDEGCLPKPEPGFLKALGLAANADFDDVFTVSVTSAVKKVLKINEAQANTQAVATVAQIVGPNAVFKHVDLDGFTRQQLVDLGLDPNLLRTEQEVAQIEKQQEQLQKANAILNAGQQVADIQQKTKGSITNGLNPAAQNNPLSPSAPANQAGLS